MTLDKNWGLGDAKWKRTDDIAVQNQCVCKSPGTPVDSEPVGLGMGTEILHM